MLLYVWDSGRTENKRDTSEKQKTQDNTYIIYCAPLGYTYSVKILTYFKMYEIIIIERKKEIG